MLECHIVRNPVIPNHNQGPLGLGPGTNAAGPEATNSPTGELRGNLPPACQVGHRGDFELCHCLENLLNYMCFACCDTPQACAGHTNTVSDAHLVSVGICGLISVRVPHAGGWGAGWVSMTTSRHHPVPTPSVPLQPSPLTEDLYQRLRSSGALPMRRGGMWGAEITCLLGTDGTMIYLWNWLRKRKEGN